MRANYTRQVCRLQREVDELRQQAAASVHDDDTDSPPTPPHPPSELRRYIGRLERHEDRHLKDQLKLVKDLGRRLERIEDVGCSYFKPRSARCRMQDELYGQLDKGHLHGIVKRDHLSKVCGAKCPISSNA